MTEVAIYGYARTPFGALQGTLSTIPAPRLGEVAIRAALERAGVKPEEVSEVIMGCVLPAGVGQAPARQAAIYAGIPESVPAMTINKVCGSGMKATILASQSIRCNDARIVVAGGMENMSLAPYYLKEARRGYRMGNQSVVDGMISDGLWDPYNNQHMGLCAEACAAEQKISREDQDEYAIESYRRAQEAQKAGKFKDEIAAVKVPGRKGDFTTVDTDEGPMQVAFDKIPTLKPVFDPKGSVTAANASSINDGAAALILGPVEGGPGKPLARIVSYGRHAQTPVRFPTAPIGAIEQALQRAGWTADDVDLFEINEAFAVVALANQRAFKIPSKRLNVLGGAISLGHPIGASGARIIGTLVRQLHMNGLRRGVAAICIGGGEGTAICIERL